MTGYNADDEGSTVSQDGSRHHCIQQVSSRDPSNLPLNSMKLLLPGAKWLKHDNDLFTSIQYQVNNVCSFTSTSPYIFMVQCLSTEQLQLFTSKPRQPSSFVERKFKQNISHQEVYVCVCVCMCACVLGGGEWLEGWEHVPLCNSVTQHNAIVSTYVLLYNKDT